MNKILRYKTTNIRGFTLVETLVSVFIITIVIVGPMTVAFNASIYAKLTKETMIATYLAQEAVELLRHHQDSVYIRCADQNVAKCSPIGGERPDETAWRVLKERLGNNAEGATCFVTGLSNPGEPGCSYDFIDMTTNEDFNPPKYASTAVSCNTLSYDPVSRIYVCSGVRGAGLKPTTFSRTIKIMSVPTFNGADQSYSDDLRVTVTVTFTRSNGFVHQVKIVDFLHAKA